jgi:hypothetical protein
MYMNRQLATRVFALAALATLASCKSNDGYEYDAALVAPGLTGFWIYDTGTVCTVHDATMHCCPAGMAMIGAHVVDNVFKCAQLTATKDSRFLDLDTARNGMRACPSGSVMVGLHVNNNQLACQTPNPGRTIEHMDGSPGTPGTLDGYPMHICPNGYAMSGIGVNKNTLACES